MGALTLASLLEMLCSQDGVRSVVVFGSVLRPEDFVPGVSDVNILVIVRDGEVRSRVIAFLSRYPTITPYVLVPEEFELYARSMHPLYLATARGYTVCDDGVFSSYVTKYGEGVSETTANAYEDIALRHISKALEELIRGNAIVAINESFRAAREVAKSVAARRGTYFEREADIAKFSRDAIGREFYTLYLSLRECRRLKIFSFQLASRSVSEASRAMSQALGTEVPEPSKVIRAVEKEGGIPSSLALVREGSKLVWHVSVMKQREVKVIKIE